MQASEEIFELIRDERGGVANIHRAFDQFPQGVSAHYFFYRQILLADNLPLDRKEREFLAVKTSEANQCPYCIGHHTAAFESIDTGSIRNQRLVALEKLAYTLTREPWKSGLIKDLFLSSGFTSAQWQHAVMIVSYFNFANRCAHAMSLELEDNFKDSCR